MQSFTFPFVISALLWLLAFVFALMPFESLEIYFFGISIVLLCGAVLAALFNIHQFIPRTPEILCGLLFWLLMLASVFFSALPFESYLFFCLISALPLGFVMFILHPDKEKLMKLCGVGLGAFMVVLSLWAAAQYLFLPGIAEYGRALHPLDNPNSLAGLLSLGFFGFFGAMLSAQSRTHANIALVCALIVIAGILATGSRAGILSLLGGIALLFLLAPHYVRKHKRCISILGLGAVLSGFAASVLVAERVTTPANIIRDTVSGKVPALWTRPHIWQSTWEMIGDHMWAGTGIGTFPYYYPAYRSTVDYASSGQNAHNDPLQFWAEMGVLAPVLFYAFIILAMIRTARALHKTGKDAPARLLIAVPFCALGAMILHTHISFHFYVLPTLFAAALLLAVWFYATGRILQDRYISLKLPAIAPSFLMLVFLLFVGGFVAAVGSEIFVQKARRDIARSSLDAFAFDVNAAAKLSHGTNARAYLAAAAFPMSILEVERHFMPEDEVAKLKAQADSLLARAERRNPRLADIIYEQARLARMSSDWAQAESYYERALALDPLNLKVRRGLAGFYRSRGEARKAFELLKDGLAWPYRSPDVRKYYNDVAMSAVQFGDPDTHALAMSKLKQ